jgi:hypothetical protein
VDDEVPFVGGEALLDAAGGTGLGRGGAVANGVAERALVVTALELVAPPAVVVEIATLLFGAGVATSAGALVTAPTSGTTSGVAVVLGGGAATIGPPPPADGGVGELPLPGHGGPPAGSTPALAGVGAGVPRIISLAL